MNADTTYSKLHKTFYANYIRNIKNDPLLIISNTRLISDPLHVLKRARYRLLAADTYLVMRNGSYMTSIDILNECRVIPVQSIFRTKVHEDARLLT